TAGRLRALELPPGRQRRCDRRAGRRGGRDSRRRGPRPRAGAVQLTAAGVVDVLWRLRAAGIDVWVEGGWGVDALLGEQTRPHDDLDLGVRMEDVDRICRILSDFERSDDEWPASF